MVELVMIGSGIGRSTIRHHARNLNSQVLALALPPQSRRLMKELGEGVDFRALEALAGLSYKQHCRSPWEDLSLRKLSSVLSLIKDSKPKKDCLAESPHWVSLKKGEGVKGKKFKNKRGKNVRR